MGKELTCPMRFELATGREVAGVSSSEVSRQNEVQTNTRAGHGRRPDEALENLPTPC